MERAIGLVTALSTTPRASLSELSGAVGLPVTTAHRLLATLAASDWVRRLDDGGYVPGPALVPIGSAAQRAIDPLVEPALAELAQRTGETANYAVLDGDAVLYLAQRQSTRMMRMFTEVGARAPAFATAVGKVLLAGLDDPTLRVVLDRSDRTPTTPRTITDVEQLFTRIRGGRSDGYATDDEERELGVRCVAVPVLDDAGRTASAISVSGPASRVDLPPSHEMLQALHTAAARIAGGS